MSLLDQLVSHWKLDELSGVRADSHGSNTLTDNNTVPGVAGKIGNAADFTAANSESLSCADSADLSFGDEDFSIAFWINFKTLPADFAPIMGKYDETFGGSEYIVGYTDRLRFAVYSPGGNGGVNADVSINTAEWHLVVAWHDSVNNVLAIQIDNGTVFTSAHTFGVRDGTNEFRIGRGVTQYLDAKVDSVSVWNRILSAQERTDIFGGGSGLDYEGFAPFEPPVELDVPNLAIADSQTGTGGTATVTDSDPEATNRIYAADRNAATVVWVLVATRIGDGTVAFSLGVGSYIFQVRSTLSGEEVSGSEVYASITFAGSGGDIYDRADGTGINVYVSAANPSDVVTAEILDTTQSAGWRDGPNRTGPGLINVPVGESDATVNFARTYRIRHRVNSSGGTLLRHSASKLVTPTQGYDSPDFQIMVNLTHALIEADIRRIGGNIHRAMYPIPMINIPDLPAIFIFQQEPETLGNLDNRSYTEDLPIVVQVADALVEEWANYVEWWHYVRRIVKKTLNRVAAYKLGQYPTGRRYRVVPGQFFLTEYEGKYLFRAQNLTVRADLEFPIEG